MPTSSPSSTRFRHRLLPTGGIQYACPSVTSGFCANWLSFIPRAITTSPARSTDSVLIHDTSLRSPGFSSVNADADRAVGAVLELEALQHDAGADDPERFVSRGGTTSTTLRRCRRR
jgi:hypothetical protein